MGEWCVVKVVKGVGGGRGGAERGGTIAFE